MFMCRIAAELENTHTGDLSLRTAATRGGACEQVQSNLLK